MISKNQEVDLQSITKKKLQEKHIKIQPLNTTWMKVKVLEFLELPNEVVVLFKDGIWYNKSKYFFKITNVDVCQVIHLD